METEVGSGTVEPTVPGTNGAPAAAAPGNETKQPTETTEPQTWEELGIKPELRQTLLDMGFALPMPVQRAVFPRMMAGKDVMVQSRTGSGKTAAFGIPFAQGLIDGEQKEVQALVLAPTRELALQVAQECEKIATGKLHVIPVYGGAPMGKQIEQLKAGAQVVAGTPGRVLDHLRRGTLKLDGLKVLVLDEADEMLSMGFLEEITEIIKRCPTDRQTVLFSATIPDDIERIGSRYMREPEKITLSADFVGVHEIKHTYYMVSGMGRARDLVRVLEVEKPESAIIFCNTREDTALVAEFLRKNGMDAEAISSDLTQKDRERVMGRMKAKDLKYLVATDIAARGIDISNLSHVINYTFPESAEVYVHRTGRTGRAGKSGLAISLISPRELGNFYMLKLTYKIKPEERTLPSDEQYRTAKEAERVDELKRKLGSREPGEPWRQLARRVWASDEGERLVALLIEDRMTPRPELKRAEPRHDSQAPRAASPGLEPVPTAGPTGGFSAPPASQKDEGEAAAAAGEREARNGEAREGGREAREGGREAREGGREEREGRERGRRSRRGGRGRERERERREGGAQASRGGERPGRRVAETIDNSDGKEFWEAWVDSKSESGTEATPGAGAGDELLPEGDADEARAGDAGDVGGAGEGEARGEGEGRRRRERRPRREEQPLPEGHARLYLNVGRRDGADEAAVQALLTERGVAVTSTAMFNSHTYLVVPEERADAVCAALTSGKYGERDLVCERARK